MPVIRWDAEPIGYVLPSIGASLDPPERSWTKVSSLMCPTPEVARAWTTESLDDVLRRQASREDLMVVVHEPHGGRVVGTLSSAQLGPVLRLPDLWGRDRPETPGVAGAETMVDGP